MSEYPDLFDLESIWPRLPCDDDETAEFSNWYKSLRGKRGFSEIRSGLYAMARRCPNISESSLLVYQVIGSCWKAHQFQTNGDPMLAKRDKYRAADELREEIAELAARLAEKMDILHSSHPLILNCNAASTSAKEQGVQVSGWPAASGISHTKRWQITVRALAHGMSAPTLGHQSGPFWHRNHVGCLHYSRPVERAKRPTTDTILLFDLVFTFRHFTANQSAFVTKQPMPTEGRPNYPLAVKIVNATLGARLKVAPAKRKLLKLVANNPGLLRARWEA